MGNDGGIPKNTGIPSWQRRDATKPEEPAETTTEQPSDEASRDKASEERPPESFISREALIEHAARFLEDESLKDATLEEKVAFLESKGLEKQDIDKALSLVNSAVTQTTSSTAPAASAATVAAKSQPLPSERVPPIITYPEFLMHAQKPPPLITVRSLLNTVYVASGLAAVIYGASKYLVVPMTDGLTHSRHEFAQHVQAQVDVLNEKLQSTVSVDPKDKPQPQRQKGSVRFEEAASEAESSDSDPTELFHRDFGTQTSPSIEVNGSDDGSTDSSSTTVPGDAVESHARDLKRVNELCSAIVDELREEESTTGEVNASIKVLKDDLEPMLGLSSIYPSNGLYTAHPINKNSHKEDEISKMKAEIRSVKGVLLSAKNFPRSRSK